MVITFSNIKGSTGGGGATGGTVSGITLWSDETTKAYIDDALSGVTDVLTAYTKTEDFATINGSAITSGGNIVVEATPYTAGTNIDITDHIISVTGISAPTKVSELVNDSGYITTADTQNFVTSGDVQTQINDSISGKADSSAVTAQISDVKAQIEAEIPSKVSDLQNDLNFASTGDVESMISGFTTSADVKTQIEGYNYINSEQAQAQIDSSVSGKLDSNVFTAYTANTQTELDNKQDASAMTAYSTTEQVQTLINTAKQEVENEIPDVSDFVTSAQVETQITSKGYITGYTETDPVFMASPASGISAQDITNWNAKLDSSALTPYYTSAQTDNAISNAVSGKADSSAVTAQISDVKAQIEAEIPTKVSDLQNDLNFASTGDVKTQIDNAVSGKQDTLVSGINIKTINNQSLLGSGNIEIQGGGETYSAGEGIGIDTDNIISVTGNYETIVELTQAEYDALTSYGKNTTYVITDAPAVNLSAYTPTSGFSTINGNVMAEI